MVSIDVRLKNEDIQILQAAVGKTLDRVEHDEFVFTNTSSQAVRLVLGDAPFYLTYDVWVTRGIIIEFGDHELAFEKPVWFSEDIVIRRGYDLIEKFQPVEEICKAGKWKDGVIMKCSREVMTL